jgi:hypothetical protein
VSSFEVSVGGKTITPPVKANQVALDQVALGLMEIVHSPIRPLDDIFILSKAFTYFEMGPPLRR